MACRKRTRHYAVNYPPMPAQCEIVEIRNSADAVGLACLKTASTQCSDCGIQLCEDHAEPCGTCFSIFCPTCRLLHRGQHSKPAHGERDRKSTRLHSSHTVNSYAVSCLKKKTD